MAKTSAPNRTLIGLRAAALGDTAASVQVLLASRRPPTISRFVVSAWVNAVDRQIARLLAHVRQEIRKRTAPAFAHGNTASAVVAILRLLRVVTSSQHGHPAGIGLRGAAASHMAMCQAVLFHSAQATTARLRAPVAKVVRRDFFGLSAVTSAQPYDVPRSCVAYSSDDSVCYQAAETLSGQIGRSIQRWRRRSQMRIPPCTNATIHGNRMHKHGLIVTCTAAVRSACYV